LKGGAISLSASFPDTLTADTPCFHSHSLMSFSAPVPDGVLILLIGCCHLVAELEHFVSEASVLPEPRSHPNPAIFVELLNL